MSDVVNSPPTTIAACASAAGGGIGVLRVSGPAALDILRAGFRPLPATLESHKMVHGWWHDAHGEPLDEGLAVVMHGPHSYTGEDVVELHLHGGALGLDRALEACIALGAGTSAETFAETVKDLAAQPNRIRHMSAAAHDVCDGLGTERVYAEIAKEAA